MSLDVAQIGPTNRSAAQDRAARGPRTPASRPEADALALSQGDVPASPPPEVLDAIGAAGDVWEDLQAQGRELRFGVDEASGRVQAQLLDRDGTVLRTLSPSQALDLATGGRVG